MVASLNWPAALPQHLQAQSARMQLGPGLVDKYDAGVPIFFVKSRAKTRRVSGALRITFPQRDFWLQTEPSFRGRRFNADFENLGATRETVIEDWSLAPTSQGVGFMLTLTMTVFDAGQRSIDLTPETGVVRIIGNAPTRG